MFVRLSTDSKQTQITLGQGNDMLNMCKIIPMSRNRVQITGNDQLDTDTL